MNNANNLIDNAAAVARRPAARRPAAAPGLAQGRYWLGTIPHHAYTPFLPAGIIWSKGQLELGAGGFLHWQLMVASPKNMRLAAVKKVFGPEGHWELSRSAAAEDYVHKDDTAVVGTRFELGNKLLKRNDPKDWSAILASAKRGAHDGN